jgi:hypothetical protein
MGNISTFEWPPKPSYASSGFAATEEFVLPWFGFLNMLNLLLVEGNCRFMLWEPFRGVRPKLHDLIFRYGDAGSDFCCALDAGDIRAPNCKEDTVSIICDICTVILRLCRQEVNQESKKRYKIWFWNKKWP